MISFNKCQAFFDAGGGDINKIGAALKAAREFAVKKKTGV